MGCISSFFIRLLMALIVFPVLALLLPLYELSMLAVLAWRTLVLPVNNLKGKVALITGAASGIGEQIAYEYARRGARLALIDINGDRLQEVSDKAKRIGSRDVMWEKADVSIPQESEHFIQQTIQRFGQLDHLVNNAAIFRPLGLFENVTDTCSLRPIMDTNFWGSVYSTHYAIPYLRQSKGKMIAVASSLGHISAPNSIMYNASKAALISLYETMRVEIGSEIGITIVTPGAIDTPMITPKYLSVMGLLKYLPSVSAEECGKQIVEGACRGDAYVRVPQWISAGLLVKAMYPEAASRITRLLFLDKKGTTSKIKP
ncbi:hypothetical protein V2J09_008591 [Rumex salicifolius]